MEQNKKLRVAITHGDTNGVGYEMILKLFEEPTILELFTPIIYGSPKLATYHAKVLGIEPQFTIINDAREAHEGRVNLLNCFGNEDINVELGVPTAESGKAALKAIDRAIADYQQGAFDVLVTTPVNRGTIEGFNGHSEYLERKFNEHAKSISILINDELRVALVTNNLAIKDIPESITKQKIIHKAELFHQSLHRDLRISSPRIAVLSLNPRCGEEGALGDEEQEIIAPAIKELAEKGLQVFGPYAADKFFSQDNYFRFEGVLAMYHDQGLIPFKTLSPEMGLRFTSGLSIVRTAPTQGTDFAVAGKNLTSPDSLRHAIYTAIDVLNNRINFDEPLKNPLPKLYHEKRDDSEKVRFRSALPGSKPNGEGKEQQIEDMEG